jgi:hypothetical protein
VSGQRHTLFVLPAGKTRCPLYRRLSGPQARSGCVRKDVTTCDDIVTMSAWPSCYTNDTDQGLTGLRTAELKNYLPAKQNYTFLFFFAEVVVGLAKFSQFGYRNNLKFWRLILGTRVLRAVRFLNSGLCWSAKWMHVYFHFISSAVPKVCSADPAGSVDTFL